ncbi:FERM domain-containing protein 6-like [Acanthochromis polyacanthus]|uniref:FERM domain-containing protein 6-like n=1 Tax=Acanthochromis polyacanthus TaxID=80966 RepID=UPI002234AE51|nr:FERM domain-containing protein 6-like [Acanthochromis polyacanthus]
MRTKWKRHVCILLPNKQHLDCAVRVRARGREVLNSVLKQLSVSDLQVFGLAVLRDNEYLFVDLDQKLSKYFGKRWNTGSIKVPFILFLRVQFYLEAGQLIMSSKEQQLYYGELRQKVLRSQSRHQEALLFQLAASALQADIGDLEQKDVEGEERKQRHYFLPEDYFPSWLIKRRGRDFLLQNSPVLHGELRGVSRSQAILQFIREASSLQDGAVTFYRMRQEKKELRSSILLGVAVKGLHIYQEVEGKQCMLHDFSWIDIDRLTFQGSRFEIAAVGSLCLPKLLYYTHSAFHSKHILRHLTDSHRLHISTRDAVSYIQQLEDMKASQLYNEAYICDAASLKQRLHCSNLASSMSDCSVAMEAATCSSFSVAVEADTDWTEEEEEDSLSEAELRLDEPEEVFVDDPAEVSWLGELLHGISVDEPPVLNSSDWAAVTMEMKQVLWRRADEGASVD